MDYIQELTKALAALDPAQVEEIAALILTAARNNKTIYIFGNGDSATNAFHFSADWAKTATMHKKRLKIACLNDNVPLLTAWANDDSYAAIFERQLETLVEKDDVVIGITTSGNSPNVLRAIECARKQGAHTIALTAFEGGNVKPLAHTVLIAKTNNVEIAEDIHFVIGHMIKQHLIQKWSR